MNKTILKKIIISTLFTHSCLDGTATFVYNLKIAEVTKHQATDEQQKQRKPFLGSAVYIDQTRKKHSGLQQNIAGGLESFIYFNKNIYLRADFAVGHVSEKLDNIHFSRTQTDDILLSGGYSCLSNERTRFSISGLFGIPTHRGIDFERIQFGIGQFGLGIQLDNAFHYTVKKNHSIRSAVRCIKFFASKIIGPIMPTQYKFTIGNLIDLFISHHSKFGMHRVEFGVNPTFLRNANITPSPSVLLPFSLEKLVFNRYSFFLAYKYVFSIADHPAGIVLGLSYGFDQKKDLLDNKRIVTFWAGLGVNF